MNNGHRIVERGRQCYYAKIPHLVIEADLSHQAFRLYCWYKKVCGQTGECWQTLDTLAAGCRMRTQSVTDARNELERAGFIEVQKTKAPNGSVTITVSIVDVWEKNNAQYDKPEINGVKLPAGIPTDLPAGISAQIPHGSSAQIPAGITKNNPTKKNPTKNRISYGGDKRPDSQNGFGLTEFYDKWAGRLRQVLVEHKADIVNPPAPRRGVRTTTLANMLFRVETERGASRQEIEAMIRWLRVAYDDEYTPRMHKAMDLRDRWQTFVDAKRRWELAGGRERDGVKLIPPETRRLARECVKAWDAEFGPQTFPDRGWIAKWCEGRGLPEGAVTREMVEAS